MQSSSALFPVALLSAERRGDLSEDVYRIKAGNVSDPSVELALTRLGQVEPTGALGIPVILLHGSFSNRRFWFSPKGIGLGAFLARAGFDVWIPEMRGHGLSPRNRCWAHNRVADYAAEDLPLIAAFVMEQTGQAPHWLGHSLGGITLAAAMGGGYLDDTQVASAAFFGTQVSRRRWPLKIPPLAWALRMLLKRFPHVSGTRLKRGPEDEPMGLVFEALRWQGLFGRFGEKGNDWWQGLASVNVPVLAVSGAADRQDPPWACRALFEQIGSAHKQYLCLGQAPGTEAFGHVDMLVSKAAQTDVWPRVLHWLEQPQVALPGAEQGEASRMTEVPSAV
ncbi:alpha/beta fold hydrolase [Pseudomonas cremoricolorata]|uniref:alpha/beta fold hydrolase n=1 Tax=Pseudomonas cremoricolorata TaxID=157783 RepID=UPI00049083D3|nr:alpha/beta fold hydrolase [Pseudomonas cremoricolorata]